MSTHRRMSLRRLAMGALGSSIVALGLLLMPLPGPGTVLVVVGLTVLQRDYPWAGRLLQRVRMRTGALGRRLGGRSTGADPEA